MPHPLLILDTNPGFPGFVRYGAAGFTRFGNNNQTGFCGLDSGYLRGNFPAGKFNAEEESWDFLPAESAGLNFKLTAKTFLQESFPRYLLDTGLIDSKGTTEGGQAMSATP